MLQNIEIAGVFIILALQVYIFYITLKKIEQYKSGLSNTDRLQIMAVYIRMDDIVAVPPKLILSQSNKYIQTDIGAIENETGYVEVNLIQATTVARPALKNILESINTYLIRNRTSVADFNLIKDIVERTTSTIEEEINNTISVPLYLGLLGTFMGIIVGLFNISSVTTNETTDFLADAIPLLLGSVKYAMMASFLGLLLTVVNSGYFFRKAKNITEQRKNDFYSFIQVELLSVLNQSINSSLASLQTNLHKFNDDFTLNLSRLGELMFKNHDAILAQDRVLTSLESIDINEFAKANVKVLKELQKSTENFHAFNLYTGSVNEAITGAKSIITKINELVNKTDNMNTLAENINKSFVENNRLITFFNDHRTSLDDSRAELRTAVSGVNKLLKDSIADLNDTTKESIIELRQMVTREIKLMNEQYPERWKKLDNLSYLENIGKSVNEIKSSNASQIERVKNEMVEMNNKLSTAIEQLESIKNRSAYQGFKRWLHTRGIIRKHS